MLTKFALAVLATQPTWCTRDVYRSCEGRVHALAAVFEDVGRARGLDPALLAAIAWVETRWHPWAVGSAGSRGAMQVHPIHGCFDPFACSESWREWCRTEADGCQRPVIDYAAGVLQRMIAKCGSVEDALGRYRTGRCGGDYKYAQHVLELRREMKAR